MKSATRWNSLGAVVRALLLLATTALILVVPAATVSAQQTGTVVNICSRTPEVQTAILVRVPGRTCSTITDTELASIPRLDTSGYSAASVVPADFAGLDGLTEIHILSSTTLTTVPARAFSEVADTLDKLGLYRNNLSSVHVDAFDGLTELTQFVFTTDSLTTVPPGIFAALTGLIELSVIVTSATTLDAQTFDGQTELKNLIVRSRQSDASFSLPVDLFDPLSDSLISLGLPDLGLTDLPEGIFDGLTGLKRLGLRCNSLTELNLDRFDPFAATLVQLDIRANSFTTPPSEEAIRAKFPSLTRLLSGPDTKCVERGLTVSFGAATYDAAEGGSVSVEVTLSEDPEQTVTVPITATNQGGATDGDYSIPTNVVFGATETSQTVTFSATQDSVDDDDESVRLGFGTLPTDVSAGTPSTSTVRITDDDDPAVTVSFGSATYDAAEGGSVTVTVELSEAPERSVTIPITRSNQDGATNGDYSGVPANVTFSATETSKTFTFSAEGDSVEDDGESVLLGFGTLPAGVSAGTPSTSTVSILDDPAVTVSFGAATYDVSEGGSVTVEVTLNTAPGRSVRIPITRNRRGGASNDDFSGVPNSLTFSATETSKTFTFRATDDSVDDDGESVRLGFGTLPTGVSLGTQRTSTVRITDDDDPAVTVRFGAASYTAAEGGGVIVTVTLSADPEREVTIPLTATNQGGAISDDYSGVPANVTFGATETSQTFTFTAEDDSVDDDDESVRLSFGTLPTGVSAGTQRTTTVRITDDDDPAVTVSFGAASYTAAEGGGVTVTVRLSADPEREVTIPLTASNRGGATDGDYSIPANVVFSASERSQTFTFSATQDSVDDDDERVLLGFGTLPAGVSAGTQITSLVAITDDDVPAVTVSFGSGTYDAAEGGSVTVTVELSEAPERSVTIPLTRSNQDGATSGDYSGVPANVTFSATEMSKTFTFRATDDSVDDDDESVRLGFGTTLPALVTAVSPSTTTVRITDDDDPAVTVSFGAATYDAAEGGSVTVTLTLSADPERSVTIPLTATNQGGAISDDYSGVPANVTFGATETSQTFTFTAEDDSVDDDDESVRLSFGTLPTGVSAGTPRTTTVRITDDDDPAVTVSFGAASYTAAEGGGVIVTVRLSADPEREVTIPLTASNRGGATDGDYSIPADVVFSASERSKTFTFSATQDSVDDDDERVLLGFGTLPAGVSAGTPITSLVAITDDDVPAVTVSFGSATYDAAEGGSVTVTVELSEAPERSVTIPADRHQPGRGDRRRLQHPRQRGLQRQ